MKNPRPLALALFALLVLGGLFIICGNAPAAKAVTASASGKWTCSMDPQFVLAEPGKCPKCFMDLIPLEAGAARGGRRELILEREAAALAGIAAAAVEPLPQSGPDAGALSIPESALLRNLDRYFVFVVTGQDNLLSFVMHEIQAGKRVGDRRVVVNGLAGGDQVASSGLYRIDSALQILGKVSLVNLPPGDLASVDEDRRAPDQPFQPAERSSLDLRGGAKIELDRWFVSYEGIRSALAKDDFAASTQPARQFRDALRGNTRGIPEEFSELFTALARDADGMANASRLEERRASFDKLSADMVLLARRYGPPAGGLNLVFCPMAFGGKGAHWLQPAEIVDNPYHGLEMPRCGWLVENIGAGKSPK